MPAFEKHQHVRYTGDHLYFYWNIFTYMFVDRGIYSTIEADSPAWNSYWDQSSDVYFGYIRQHNSDS